MIPETFIAYVQQRLGPEGVRQAFYLMQLGVGAAFVGAVWFMRSREPKSGFAVREADLLERRKAARAREPGSGGARDPLGEAQVERPAPLSLPGIRIDGPPHEILGLPPGAGADEINRAYRELMKRYHPDKVGRPDSREWRDAQKIAEALNRAKNELLKRAARRR